jgi:hypothetical protein
MSNFQAIATVTATIAYLMNGIQGDVPAASITTKPPDVIVNDTPQAGLNIFLYQVNLNQGYRNMDQPARDSSGNLVTRPRLALNLDYLITATGDGNDDIQAHQILASAMRILNENPVLSSSTIENAVAAQSEIQGSGSIPASDLAYQVEQVKVAPLALKLDELTKIWSSFFQSNYRVSTAYEVTVVLIDSDLSTKPSLPVASAQISALPFTAPIIQTVSPQVLAYSPTALLTIKGLNLTGTQFQTSVIIDGSPASFDPTKASSTQISLVVPSTVTPGIKSVQIVLGVIPPSGPPALPGFKSNVMSFVLAPTISGGPGFTVAQGADLTLNFTPDAGPEQQVDFLIGDYTVSLPQSSPIVSPVGQVTMTIPPSIPTGTYLLRIRIDGAESLLQPWGGGSFVSPTLTVT